jgi:uncharacterized membrane protein YqjE
MPPQHVQNGRSMGEILQDIIADVQEIVRSEFRLAKAEVQQETAKVARSGIPLIVGLLLGLYALGFILLAAVHALSIVVAAWLAALIVGFVVGVVSLILINIGRNRLKGVKVVPEKTIGTVKENVQWARNQIR